MAGKLFFICGFFLFCCSMTDARFFIVPEDVAMLFTTIYGFAPPIHKGNDHRLGFGYRFGNHADLQVLYELGPQVTTKQLTSVGVPPLPSLDRRIRRPLVNLLVRRGILKENNNNSLRDTAKPK
ncbi:uncharacterized protein LOC119838177 [Zerene cesonia]|uniref:uncharacterized protein LOC119838177 n=1 Tax=Zerene cesonia TaxID=33412 RepID=UPI0018E518FF|nr:uncharacterized protein LOC119838177 [Zerene cesonia]